MIIFTPLKELPVEYLEYKGIRQVVIYNLSSYFSHAPTLNHLIPSSMNIPEDVLMGDCDNAIFDMHYHKYVLENNESFMQFMGIVNQSFMYPDALIYIMVMNSPYSNAITESLMKLIQQRYGANSYMINEPEDFLYVEECDFSVPGIFAMDNDIKRMLSMSNIQGDLYE